MRIKALLATAIMSGVLVGCVTVPTDPKLIVGRPPPMATFFNYVSCAPNCTVKVEVVGDCQFKVPDLVVLSGIAGRRHAVVWVIQSSDYVFSTTSGAPALAPKGSPDFFGSPHVLGPILGVEVTVTTPGKSHEYGLNIAKRSGSACPQVDPFVME
jgi:hypothetical protein